MKGLELVATPLLGMVPAGVAGALAIILFTVVLRAVWLPLWLVQIRSQRAQMAIQPELKTIQRKFKGDREGLARAQMALYKERGINPAAGCLPLLIQMPILFGMYAAMSQLATVGLTLDQITQRQLQPGQIVYAAERHQEPLPYNQFVLAQLHVVPHGTDPIPLTVQQDQSSVSFEGKELLSAKADLTLTPGAVPPAANQNPPTTQSGSASIFLRGGEPDADGITMDRDVPVPTDGGTYIVEVWVDASGTNADSARVTLSYDPAQLDVLQLDTPTLQPADVAFKSHFLWLPSLGQPDTFRLPGINFSIPGLLLIVMTITSVLSHRMTTMPTEDPQQQAMMRSMAFMPLMYLFFFVNTPAGLVVYWLTSNVFSMFQQYFTVGLGMLGGDVLKHTGRDLQPPWAPIPGSTAPTAAALVAADSSNGRADGNSNHKDGTIPGSSTGAAGSTRRP